jgi:TolB-like protein
MNVKFLAVLAAVVALAPCGCKTLKRELGIPDLSPAPPEQPAPVAYRDGTVDFGAVRRVLALPLYDESEQGDATALLSRTLGEELSRLRRFDVVTPTASDAALKSSEAPHRIGQVPIQSIIELGRRYSVDAVVFGTVSEYRPYAPPRVALKLSLVDTQTGRVLWQVDDYVDSADARTAHSMRKFFDGVIDDQNTQFGDELLLTSPELFARYALRRSAKTLLE